MLSLPVGFIFSAVILFLSIDKAFLPLFLNFHAFVIVVLGTVAVFLFGTPMRIMKSVFFEMSELLKGDISLRELEQEIQQISTSKSLMQKSRNPLIMYAVEMWKQGVESELFIVLLSQKRSELEDGSLAAIQALRNLAKYPPALGMTGTVIGLVSLFSKLGENQGQLGSALALAMTATFFGLVTANFLIQPLADRLQVRFMTNKRLYTNIYQILLLINNGEAPSLVTDEVKNRVSA